MMKNLDLSISFSKENNDFLTPSLEDFLKAIESGDLSRVEYYISVGVDVNSPPHLDIMPPLGYAIAYGYTDIVKTLLKAGAEVHDFFIAQLPHLPSIVEVANQEVYDILTLLIEAGIDINFPLEEEDTLLHKAIEDRDLPFVDFLIKAGADVNVRNQYGWTPLMSTAFFVDTSSHGIYTQLEIVKFLLEHGADIELKDNRGKNVLELAEEDEIHKEVIELLEKNI
ncbi:ankyrin repeat domain-containing protein [Roseofilum sp. Guam]|uniref:ankyrin repeat domain-containing protein n=1 Tax=Roseofilum sp. Guam TaxID=2821502 RepID=UPI001B14FBB2|nr:ankyrin repeat domain-containing protein [Roseofilum sp. Guam]MBP0027711.1 ankyrin repeat domain-containing protein [Roseofilum sp. Guam]